jgi:hypothetical protein
MCLDRGNGSGHGSDLGPPLRLDVSRKVFEDGLPTCALLLDGMRWLAVEGDAVIFMAAPFWCERPTRLVFGAAEGDGFELRS